MFLMLSCGMHRITNREFAPYNKKLVCRGTGFLLGIVQAALGFRTNASEAFVFLYIGLNGCEL